MTDLHPIVPSEGLKEEWESEWHHYRGQDTYEEFMAKQAAQWGADQELKACCEWLDERTVLNGSTALRAARRPKPPSEADQALETLNWMESEARYDKPMIDPIRRCLERLKKLEEATND